MPLLILEALVMCLSLSRSWLAFEMCCSGSLSFLPILSLGLDLFSDQDPIGCLLLSPYLSTCPGNTTNLARLFFMLPVTARTVC